MLKGIPAWVIKLGLILNALLVLVTICSYISPYIDPSENPHFAIYGLGFSYLLLANFIALFIWLIVKPKWALIPLLTVLLGYFSLKNVFAFAGPKSGKPYVSIGTLNTQFFKSVNLAEGYRKKRLQRNLYRFLSNQNSTEILCFQEYGKYPSHFVDSVLYHEYKFVDTSLTVAIYSSYPILNHGVVDFKTNIINTCIWADIDVDADTIRVFNFHLESNQKDGQAPTEIVENAPENLDAKAKMGIVRHYKEFTKKRSEQAKQIRAVADKSPYPVILCGDLNEPPLSFTYNTISKGLSDAFLKSGKGSGNTHDASKVGLRIDYILTDPSIFPDNFNVEVLPFSDHHFVTTDLQFK